MAARRSRRKPNSDQLPEDEGKEIESETVEVDYIQPEDQEGPADTPGDSETLGFEKESETIEVGDIQSEDQESHLQMPGDSETLGFEKESETVEVGDIQSEDQESHLQMPGDSETLGFEKESEMVEVDDIQSEDQESHLHMPGDSEKPSYENEISTLHRDDDVGDEQVMWKERNRAISKSIKKLRKNLNRSFSDLTQEIKKLTPVSSISKPQLLEAFEKGLADWDKQNEMCKSLSGQIKEGSPHWESLQKIKATINAQVKWHENSISRLEEQGRAMSDDQMASLLEHLQIRNQRNLSRIKTALERIKPDAAKDQDRSQVPREKSGKDIYQDFLNSIRYLFPDEEWENLMQEFNKLDEEEIQELWKKGRKLDIGTKLNWVKP
jgi:hypothetical protein